MAHALLAEELPQFLAVACTAARLRRLAGGHPHSLLAGRAAAMAMGLATGRRRRPERAADVPRRDAVLHRIYLRLAAGCGPDRKRPADAADHCHRTPARQHHSPDRRAVCRELRVQPRRAGSDADSGALRAADGRRGAQSHLDRRLSVPDGPCRAPAAADHHCLALGRARAEGDRAGLSITHQGTAYTVAVPSDARRAGAGDRASREVGDHPCGPFRYAPARGRAQRRDRRILPPGRQLRGDRRDALAAARRRGRCE